MSSIAGISMATGRDDLRSEPNGAGVASRRWKVPTSIRALLVRKLISFVGVSIVISLIVFFVLHLTPGDPALLLLGDRATPKALAALRAKMGLNRPLPAQYLIWVRQLLTGDLGRSAYSGEPVAHLMAQAFPPTAFLITLSVVVSIPVAVVLGALAARQQYGWLDRGVRAFITTSLSIPTFWLGIMLIVVFAVVLHWLPAGGYVSPTKSPVEFSRDMVLPVLSLSLYLIGTLTRFVYARMSEVLREDYVRMARAMGLSEPRVLVSYALRNALVPLIAVVGTQIGVLVSGAVLVEEVFGLGGFGQLVLQSVLDKDYQVVQGCVLVSALIVLFVTSVADVLYKLVDPRSRD